ncbi:MAG: hypothetical protein WC675_03610 [Patescibacteria group bacterium]|jgi:hypothetical protein
MTKKINSANLHTQHVRITLATKEKLRRVAFKFKKPESHIADDILNKYLDFYHPKKF